MGENSNPLDLKLSLPTDLEVELEDIPRKTARNSSPGDLDDNRKRWLVIGIMLYNILTPVLRTYVEPIVTKLCYTLTLTNHIDIQTFSSYLRSYPPTKTYLNYEAINNNKGKFGRQKNLYDYKVRNPVDLSKLFLQTHLAHYTAFDETCDTSALLGIIINIDEFPVGVREGAENVRSKIRNEWAHCTFLLWDAAKFTSSYHLIEYLIILLGLDPVKKARALEDLHKWHLNGLNFLQGTCLGLELVPEFHHQTQLLAKCVYPMACKIDENQNEELINVEREIRKRVRPLEERVYSELDDLDDNRKRWLVIGIMIFNILTPVLRKYIEPIVTKLCYRLTLSNHIDVQTFPSYLRSYPPTNAHLNYEAINNNKRKFGRQMHLYDYKVRNPVDLSKLFLPTHKAHYTAFDETCDTWALLGIIINIDKFPVRVRTDAEDVRSKIRNEWVHCNFLVWDAAKFTSSYQLMEKFIKLLSIDKRQEYRTLEDLNKWFNNGLNFLAGTRVGLELELLSKCQQKAFSCNTDVNVQAELENLVNVKAELRNIEREIRKRVRLYEEKVNPKQDSIEMSCIICDGIYIDCIVDARLLTTYNTQQACLKGKNTSTNDFGQLVSAWYSLSVNWDRRSGIIQEQLTTAINDRHFLLCRFLLSNIRNSPLKENFLFNSLKHAISQGCRQCSKAIAWFITRAFFVKYRYLLPNLIDLWPAIKCSCSNGVGDDQKHFCSSTVCIMVELENGCKDLPGDFLSVQVSYLSNNSTKSKEGVLVREKIQNSKGNIHFLNQQRVSGQKAEQLFLKHSKLTLISKSPFKSFGYNSSNGVIHSETQCIQLFCRAKGFIPLEETHFPAFICGLRTDVLEGSPTLASRLQVGSKIGTDDLKQGTLGGFVMVRGDKAFLTCLHIFLSTEQLASKTISLDDHRPYFTKCYTDNQYPVQPFVCGKIREMGYETDDPNKTSIDAALVNLMEEVAVDEKQYVATDNQEKSHVSYLGLATLTLNENCVRYKPLCYATPKPTVSTVSVGAISGLSDNDTSEISKNKHKSIDLEPIEQTFSTALLYEIKAMVVNIIDFLQSEVFTTEELMTTEELDLIIKKKLDSRMSQETQEVVASLVKDVYLSIRNSSVEEGTADYEKLINEKVTATCQPDSSLSAIIGDIHLQRTFLKKKQTD